MRDRILIKISGEALGNENSTYDIEKIQKLKDNIQKLKKKTDIGIIVGGGNIFRGASVVEQLETKRDEADFMGMLATIQNGIALKNYFNNEGLNTEIFSSIGIKKIVRKYSLVEAEEEFNKDKVLIFAGGLGLPYLTTDTTAVQRALEVKANMVIMTKNGVDGVYNKDPRKESDAVKYDVIDASQSLKEKLYFADFSAVSLAMQHNLPIKVISLDDLGDAMNKKLGTIINPV